MSDNVFKFFQKYWRATIITAVVLSVTVLYISPIAVLSPDTVELGDIPDLVYKEYKFKIFNIGLRSISIEKIVASCGCLGNPLVNASVPPFRSVEMTGRFSSGYRRRKVDQVVIVETNSVVNNRLTAHIIANVSPLVLVEPNQVSIGNISRNELPIAREVVLSFTTEIGENEITANADRLFFSVKAAPLKSDLKTWIVTTTIDKTVPLGVLSANVKILSKANWSKSIAISGKIFGTANSNPDTIYFGDMFFGEQRKEKVTVTGLNLRNATIGIDPKSASNRIGVEILNDHELQVYIKNTAREGVINGHMTIHDSNESMEIPVFGNVIGKKNSSSAAIDIDKVSSFL